VLAYNMKRVMAIIGVAADREKGLVHDRASILLGEEGHEKGPAA
jgi:hypothetical protein